MINKYKHILVTIIHKPPCICSLRPSHGSAAVKVSRSWSSTEAVETEALGLQVHAWHGRNFQSLGSILYTIELHKPTWMFPKIGGFPPQIIH